MHPLPTCYKCWLSVSPSRPVLWRSAQPPVAEWGTPKHQLPTSVLDKLCGAAHRRHHHWGAEQWLRCSLTFLSSFHRVLLPSLSSWKSSLGEQGVYKSLSQVLFTDTPNSGGNTETGFLDILPYSWSCWNEFRGLHQSKCILTNSRTKCQVGMLPTQTSLRPLKRRP